MTASGDLLIGIDGGGTNTRIVISDKNGNVIVYQEHKRAASLYKDLQARDNVQMAIRLALAETGRLPRQVCGIAAGIAGFDKVEDLSWVQELTNLEDITCSRWHVNDAVVAHYGALIAKPGIVAIAGTGSILFGINEEGSNFRNYDFHHYAESAARFLSYDAVYEALAGHTDDSDQLVIEAMLAYWGVANLTELSNLGRNGFHSDAQERNRKFSSFSPILTKAALEGSSLAKTVCNRAIHQIVVGIRLLGRHFSADPVPVACIGSVINSHYFQRQLALIARERSVKSFDLVEPRFPPAVGALLYAFEQLQIPITETVIHNLTYSLSRYLSNHGMT